MSARPPEPPPEQRTEQSPPAPPSVARLFRFLVHHLNSVLGSLVVFLSAGLVVAATALGVFAWLAEEVIEGDTERMDHAVLTFLEGARSAALDEAALNVTAIGEWPVLTVVTLFVLLVLLAVQRRALGAVLVVGSLGGALMNQVMKYTFDRPRPSVVEWVTQVSSPSFPSGHAMGSLVVFASVALVITRLTRTKGLRAFTWALAALLVAAVGASRLYLGVHYPSDVIAGYLAGAGWLGVVVLGERGVGGVRRARRARHGARDEGEPSPPRPERRAPAPEERLETHETH